MVVLSRWSRLETNRSNAKYEFQRSRVDGYSFGRAVFDLTIWILVLKELVGDS